MYMLRMYSYAAPEHVYVYLIVAVFAAGGRWRHSSHLVGWWVRRLAADVRLLQAHSAPRLVNITATVQLQSYVRSYRWHFNLWDSKQRTVPLCTCGYFYMFIQQLYTNVYVYIKTEYGI